MSQTGQAVEIFEQTGGAPIKHLPSRENVLWNIQQVALTTDSLGSAISTLYASISSGVAVDTANLSTFSRNKIQIKDGSLIVVAVTAGSSALEIVITPIFYNSSDALIGTGDPMTFECPYGLYRSAGVFDYGIRTQYTKGAAKYALHLTAKSIEADISIYTDVTT